MIILGTTSHSLRAFLSGAAATTNPSVTCSSRDMLNSVTSTYTPQSQASSLNGATPVTIVSSPAASHQIAVDFISVYNADTASVTLTVSFYNAADFILWKGVLAVGETLTWSEGIGWNRALPASALASVSSTGVLTIPEVASPSTPVADNLSIFGMDYAGRTMPGFLGSDGIPRPGQAFLGQVRVGWWNPPSNTTATPSSIGIPDMGALSGSIVTSRTWATTSAYTRIRRVGYVTASAVAGAFTGIRWGAGTNLVTLGDGAGIGGFLLVGMFGCSDPATVAGARQWYGLQNNGSLIPGDVSGFTNGIWIGNATADTNLKIYYGGSVAQTPVDLGANFPANTLSVDMYEITFWSPPYAYYVDYRVRRMGTSFTASGRLSGNPGTALPLPTTGLGFQSGRTNNLTALTCSIDFGQQYLETEY